MYEQMFRLDETLSCVLCLHVAAFLGALSSTRKLVAIVVIVYFFIYA